MNYLKNLILSKKMKFDQLGVYVLVLMIVAWYGFGPSYFQKMLGQVADFSIYFHLHAFFMVVWLLVMFVQPALIRQGRFKIHKQIGKLSYGLFPTMILSILLLIHHQLNQAEFVSGADFFIPFKDIVIMTFSYILGVYWKRDVARHSRLMIASVIPMIEPSLVRMFFNVLPESIVEYSYPFTILVVNTIILSLAINDFKKGRVRWIFSGLLIVMAICQTIIIFEFTEANWMVSLAKWYARLL